MRDGNFIDFELFCGFQGPNQGPGFEPGVVVQVLGSGKVVKEISKIKRLSADRMGSNPAWANIFLAQNKLNIVSINQLFGLLAGK